MWVECGGRGGGCAWGVGLRLGGGQWFGGGGGGGVGVSHLPSLLWSSYHRNLMGSAEICNCGRFSYRSRNSSVTGYWV